MIRRCLPLPGLVSLTFCLTAALSGQARAVDGLLGYWTFDADGGSVAIDQSGNGHDGEVIQPDDAWVTDPDRGAVYQSGGGSYIDLGTFLPVLDLDTDFTWSLWVNPDETDNNNIVFGNRYNTDGADFSPREFIKFTPRVFEWHFDGAGQNIPGDETMFVVGEWTHNLVVKAGAELIYYRNGEEVGRNTITGAPQNPQPLYLGGQNGQENFSGLFDEVAVFDRALDPAEVQEVYDLGLSLASLGGAPDDPNLLAPRQVALGRVPAVPTRQPGQFSLQNRGASKALEISAITLSGPQADHFEIVTATPLTIEPGASATVEFIFDSQERTGAFLATANLASNDPGDPTLRVDLSASVINLQGPQAHYRLDEPAGAETLTDSSGRNRDGAFQPGAGTLRLGVPGLTTETGTALAVSQGAQARVLGDTFDDAFGDFSVALWFQATDLSAELRTLVGKGGGTPSFAILAHEGSLLWLEGEDPAPRLTTEADLLQAGQTHHLVAVSDRRPESRRIAIYLDGALVAEDTNPDRVLDEAESPFYLGAFNHALGFEGILDDVQLYDRALSGDHVTLLQQNPGSSLGDLTPPDSDGDGLSDGQEAQNGTDPLRKDTDADGLEDGAEVNTHGTDPLKADTDDDGFKDAFEIRQGTDPLDAASKPEASAIPGLYAYWRFDDGDGDIAADASGNGRDGLIIEPDGVWIDDPTRGSVYHSTASSWVEFGEIIPAMDLDGGFTWSFWANSEETDNNNIVFGNRYNTDGADFSPREFIKFTPRAFEWHVDGAGQNVDFDDFEVDVWTHHLVVKEGDLLSYYRDGEMVAETTIASAPINPQPLYLGGQNAVETWSGLLDEVALWDRALTPSEIAQVFELGEAGQSLTGGANPPPVEPSPSVEVTVNAAGDVTLTWPTTITVSAVQFSRDLVTWETIAQSPAGESHTDTDAARTEGAQGYYRLAH